MIQIRVTDMQAFLQTVNECMGSVRLVCPDGQKKDIRWETAHQLELQQKHRERQSLPLTLEIPNPKDYLKLVYFSIWDF